jgi:hypothetical protein
MTIEIPLGGRAGKERFATIDDEDWSLVGPLRWTALKNRNTFYAYRHAQPRTMHQLIMDFTGIDHIDGNGLNNRRSNLRVVEQWQNSANQRKLKPASSVYKGVSLRWNALWAAYITVKGRRIHLGVFADELAAAKSYDSAAMKYFGDYARLNLPLGEPAPHIRSAEPS